jgi:hypothetical protein
MKIKKKFFYKGVELKIIVRPEKYLESSEPIMMTRVLAPNGAVVPVSIRHKETLKSIAERTVSLLDSFEARGAAVIKELTAPPG